jgi:hypothetical protein
MIVFVSSERFIKLAEQLRRNLSPELRREFMTLSYEQLLFERAGPVGHYIFTDFDRLTRYEIETVVRFIRALQSVAPEAKILNHPLKALERTPLLVALHRAGINDFDVFRLDTGEKPRRYPVFIRAEDGYGGPETDLIYDEASFEAALAGLDERGLPTKGRIAIGYAASPDADGYYRKYGCFNIDGDIVAFHVHRHRHWVVKSNPPGETRSRRIGRRKQPDDLLDEGFKYVRDNPHREQILKAFQIAGIDYGRADYGLVNGKVQIYEINTNPNYGGRRRVGLAEPHRARRQMLIEKFESAFRRINSSIAATGRVHFKEERPRVHRIHMPRKRLPQSLWRRITDQIGRVASVKRPVQDRGTAGGG